MTQARPENRELLMQQIILGKSEKACARALNWSASKVAYHRDQILKIYNAHNMAQAVYLWMKKRQDNMR